MAFYKTYVLIEGKPNCCEHQLWELLRQEIFTGVDGILCASGYKGITHILNMLNQSIEEKGNIRVLVCFDTTAFPKNVASLKKQLRQWEKSNQKSQMSVCYTDEYCAEDCLLLFSKLYEWLFPDGKPRQDKKYISQIFEHYRSASVYKTSEEWQDDPELLAYSEMVYGKGVAVSSEILAARILLQLTKHTVLETNKGCLGKCWYCSCINDCDLSIHSQIAQKKSDREFDGLCSWQSHQAFFNHYECGLFKKRNAVAMHLKQLNFSCTHFKISELVDHTPMLSQLKANYPWLVNHNSPI